MLLHRVIGVTGRGLRPIALAAAAPVDADHPQPAWEQRCGELDPVLAGEIAMDKDDGDVALSPFPPAQADLSRTHLRHLCSTCSGRPSDLVRPASAPRALPKQPRR